MCGFCAVILRASCHSWLLTSLPPLPCVPRMYYDYSRNLFDENNYDDCPQNGEPCPIPNFYFLLTFLRPSTGLMLKSLKRNFSKEANNVIDWIELGCFDALEKQYVFFPY